MKGNTVLKFFLGVIALVFVIHQCISTFYKPITTESAVRYKGVDGINITGIIIRNESVVESTSDGVLHFVIDDGNRVAKNGTIANIYDNESSSLVVSQMDSIQQQLKEIKELSNYNNLEATDLNLIKARENESLNNLIRNCSTGIYYETLNYSDQLLTTINKKQIAMGVTTDFAAQEASLNTQLNTLNASLPTAKGSISAASSGYFVSTVDGYESVLTCDDLSVYTPEYLNEIKPTQPSKNTIGKIVSDYEWYIAAEIDINDSLKYKAGDSLKLLTSVKSYESLPVSVKKINLSDSSSKAVVILACSKMNSELASMRTAPMTLVNAEYDGLKISKSALRVVDSTTGVYIVNGMQAKFVPVNVLYTSNSYIICEKQVSNESVLRLYDKVIVKGKNLYDGKIIS